MDITGNIQLQKLTLYWATDAKFLTRCWAWQCQGWLVKLAIIIKLLISWSIELQKIFMSHCTDPKSWQYTERICSILNRTVLLVCFLMRLLLCKKYTGNSLLQLIQSLTFLKSVKTFHQDTKEATHHAIIHAGSFATCGWTYALLARTN